MKDHEPLKKLLETLIQLKASMQYTAKPGVNEAIDDAIMQIQLLIKDNEKEQNSQQKALEVLGELFAKLPSVIALLDLFFG